MVEVLGQSKTKDGQEYTEADLERIIAETTKRGAVDALFHMDAHGPDKEKVRALMVDYVAAITREPGVLYCKGIVEEAIEQGDVYSTAAEVRILAERFSVLHQLALKYGPIAVEVRAPRTLYVDLEQAHHILVDASQSMQQFSNYIMEKVLPEEDKQTFQQHLKRRADLMQKVVENHAQPKPAVTAEKTT